MSGRHRWKRIVELGLALVLVGGAIVAWATGTGRVSAVNNRGTSAAVEITGARIAVVQGDDPLLYTCDGTENYSDSVDVAGSESDVLVDLGFPGVDPHLEIDGVLGLDWLVYCIEISEFNELVSLEVSATVHNVRDGEISCEANEEANNCGVQGELSALSHFGYRVIWPDPVDGLCLNATSFDSNTAQFPPLLQSASVTGMVAPPPLGHDPAIFCLGLWGGADSTASTQQLRDAQTDDMEFDLSINIVSPPGP